MALVKNPVSINFANGLDQKTDPKQIQIGNFLALNNTILDKGGLLQKRNGFKKLPSLPDFSSKFATTFNGDLTAIGTELNALSSGSNSWVTKGKINPVSLNVLSIIRNTYAQTQSDTAMAPNGLMCVVYTEIVAGANVYKYAIIDSSTGQYIISPTTIGGADTTYGTPKVFFLGQYFIILYTNKVSTTYHLKYLPINATHLIPGSPVDVSTTYTPATTVNFDGLVVNNSLYIAFNGSDMGGAIRVTILDQTLTLHTPKVITGYAATLMSIAADLTGSTAVIYVSFYNSSGTVGYTTALDPQLTTILAPTQFINSAISNLTSAAENGQVIPIYEVPNTYSYDSGIVSNYISFNLVTVSGAVAGSTVAIRSLGLASKAFLIGSNVYFVGIYSSDFQPTYFVADIGGNIICKLAYENGSAYYTTGLPQINLNGSVASFSYLFKDFIQAQNKSQGANAQAGIYSQTGINLASIDFNPSQIVSTEIGNNLNISGGLVWAYDGTQSVEQGFNVWPDSIEATWSASGGSIVAQPDSSTNTDAYFYQVTYEWTDNQGNLFRSAPSVPIPVTTTGSGSSGSIIIDIPTLRLTYKITNPVNIVIYRWSVAQQTYFQVTSITSPLLNDPTTDSVSFTDTLADISIIGNNILYTTGGVVEDIAPPATDIMTLYGSRLFLVDSEDRNLLWYSKQVIEATPVEMSDLFTLYVTPTTGAQGSTGPVTALSPLDDKLIIFKKDAIYYLTGIGPDNTGANNDYSNPIFITGTVGCANPNSIVYVPSCIVMTAQGALRTYGGLVFQSDKGIWILTRDLQTYYIGAPVEDEASSAVVLSALGIPGTNQVRFTLDSGVTLRFDYYYGQWGTFTGIPALSSTLYKNLHTYIDSFGNVFQENPGNYLDGSSPVLMSFTTGWINLAGLQGYERIYYFYLLGTYISPHKLVLQIAYDYQPGINQQIIISPFNFNANWGGDQTWGQSKPWGGTPSLEQWQIHMQRQQCQAFQITMNEVFDASYGVAAGAGLTLSGINCMIGISKARRPIGQRSSTG